MTSNDKLQNDQPQNPSRRTFLRNLGFFLTAPALVVSSISSNGCSSVSVFEVQESEAQRVQREYSDLLHIQDSFVGQEGLEGLFQQQYNLRTDTELRLRSAPSIAQLPYPIIRDILCADASNPIVMLYPGGGHDITPILFGHILHKLHPQVPFKAIYTEIDYIFPMCMSGQLDWLKKKGIIDFGQDRIKKEGMTVFQFEILTSSGKMMIEYRIRLPSDKYFTQEDADEANFFRENYTFDGTNNQAFIAEMAKKGKTKDDKPTLIMFPDYDRLGLHYTGNMEQGYSDSTNTYTMPDRFITKIELKVLEEQIGPRHGRSASVDNPNPQARPLRDVPGNFFLSRGYCACSCNGCMEELGKMHPHFENQRFDYTVLYRPEDIENMTQDELTRRLNAAFNTMPKPEIGVYQCDKP